jgi:membrane protease YdiL (CAAX protease family)
MQMDVLAPSSAAALAPATERPVAARGGYGGLAKPVVKSGGGYGKLGVFRETFLTVAPGETVGIFGPNGAGKTTLLSTIMGLLPAMSGRVMLGGGAWGVLLLLGAAAESLIFPGRYAWTADWSQLLPFVAVALLLTPLQCLAEELMFRGYLVQALARLSRRPAFLAVTSSILFTLPHLFNPEVEAYGAWIMAANYFAMALFLATIALRDGRLELAIGAHTSNNLLLALGVNYADSVFETPSLFTANTLDPVYSLVTLLLGAAVFHLWVFRLRSANE